MQRLDSLTISRCVPFGEALGWREIESARWNSFNCSNQAAAHFRARTRDYTWHGIDELRGRGNCLSRRGRWAARNVPPVSFRDLTRVDLRLSPPLK